MKKRVGVITDDPFLYQKIYLILKDRAEVFRADTADADADCDLLLTDIESAKATSKEDFADGTAAAEAHSENAPKAGGSATQAYAARGTKSLTMSRGGATDIHIPFTPDTLLELISENGTAPALTLGHRAAYLRGREIKLTEVEDSLLSRLVEAAGAYVSRAELIRSVWGNGATSGVLNVYIHYLREKLEANGEKIILSSRMGGYKIDEKYLK